MAVNVNSLGRSVSAPLTYSSEVMVGKVVLMQPRLNLIHRAEGLLHASCLEAVQA